MSDSKEFDVFLIHDGADRALVGRIARALEDRGLSVSLDPILVARPSGPTNALKSHLRRCRSIAVLLGPAGIPSWQRGAIDEALQHTAGDTSFRIVPVLLPGAATPNGPLSLYQWVDLRDGLDNPASMNRMAAAVLEEPKTVIAAGSLPGEGVAPERGAIGVASSAAGSLGAKASGLAAKLRGGLRRLRARWAPKSMADLDRLPTPVLVALGLIPAAALAWLALHNPMATAALLLLIPAAAIWQGRRVRVVWEHGIPAEVEVVVPMRRRAVVGQPAAEAEEPDAEPVAAPQPPYPLRDPLIELMALPGGTFRMGSDKVLDPQAYDNEMPPRQVSIAPFATAVTPITRGLYRAVMQSAPQEWQRGEGTDDLPANYVAWEDAVRFCNALSEHSGLTPCYREGGDGWTCDWEADGYRLPTEAEWEHACRAGTETPWFWGTDEQDAGRYAWFSDNSEWAAHPVGEKEPNASGLRDMAGNVWEWCWDWYARSYDPADLDNPRGPAKGDRRVLRGGSFHLEPRDLRSAVRVGLGPELRSDRIGFRCVRGSVRQLDH